MADGQGDKEDRMTTRMVRRLQVIRSERGATAIEYALMVMLIALVIIASVTLLGTNLSGFFTSAANSI
jgi:pilus assembly protein Flp/PilA